MQKTSSLIDNLTSSRKIFYVVESNGWSIHHDGESITSRLPNGCGKITFTSLGINNSIIHFGSINTFFQACPLKKGSNKLIVTCFHYDQESSSTIKTMAPYLELVDLWHTSCSITKATLIDMGIPSKKIIKIPLGISLEYFIPSSIEEKLQLRKRLGIPSNYITIGSFQKDGNGWGEGLSPKLIKGPDIFCDVVIELAKRFPIFVLLSGPARGYVKKRLEKANILFHHQMFSHSNDVAELYKITDITLVTSRIEGGPKAILESLASGSLLVTTKVGMAPDILTNDQNAKIVNVEDTIGLIQACSEIIENPDMKESFIQNGFKVVQKYTWDNVASLYWKQLYTVLTDESDLFSSHQLR